MNFCKRLVVLSFLSLSVFAVQARWIEAKISVRVGREKTFKELSMAMLTKITKFSKDKIKSFERLLKYSDQEIEEAIERVFRSNDELIFIVSASIILLFVYYISIKV